MELMQVISTILLYYLLAIQTF